MSAMTHAKLTKLLSTIKGSNEVTALGHPITAVAIEPYSGDPILHFGDKGEEGITAKALLKTLKKLDVDAFTHVQMGPDHQPQEPGYKVEGMEYSFYSDAYNLHMV